MPRIEITWKKLVAFLLFFVGLVTFFAGLFTLEGGQLGMERTPTGKLVGHMSPGIKFKVPYAASLYKYNEVTTVTYSQESSDASSSNKPFLVTFGDGYSAAIEASFRVEMPTNPEKFVSLHKAFKRYDNFVNNGIEKFTNELLTNTASQFTGETFVQGGLNEFKMKVLDQAKNGLYVTKRVPVRLNTQRANVGLKKDEAGKTEKSEAVKYITVIQRDESGKPLRIANPLAQYEVTISQVTINGFTPDKELAKFIKNKKVRIQERAKLIEEQENERQKAITEKLKGDRERVQAKQKMLKEKDAAVIAAQKKVELEQKEADLQVVRKKKELEVAKANEGIQQANEKAAKFEAQAMLHKGLAEAKIIKAKYNAYDKQLYSMEIQRDTMKSVTANLQGITVKMPNVNIQGNSEGTPINSVDTVLQAIGVQKLEEIAKKDFKAK